MEWIFSRKNLKDREAEEESSEFASTEELTKITLEFHKKRGRREAICEMSHGERLEILKNLERYLQLKRLDEYGIVNSSMEASFVIDGAAASDFLSNGHKYVKLVRS